MALKEILLADIGGAEAEVIEIMVSVGDTVEIDDSLITLESDKASMEIPATDAGKIASILINLGDNISEGMVIMKIETVEAGSTTPAEEPAPVETAAPVAEEPVAQKAVETEAPVAAPTGEAQTIEVKVPDIGGAEDVPVIEVLVKTGDSVQQDDALVTLESDKASMEIPAPETGVIESFDIKVGDTLSEGDVIMTLKVVGGSVAPAVAPEPIAPVAEKAPAPTPKPAPKPATPAATTLDAYTDFSSAYASPSVRRFARELGVNLTQVVGSGEKQRVTHDDVKQFIKSRMSSAIPAATGGGLSLPPMPAVDFSRFGEIKTEELTKINRLTGEFLHRNWVTIPHVTQFEDVDITDMEAFRKELGAEYKPKGIKITPLVFMIKAVVSALKAFPRFNSSLSPDGNTLILKQYYHVGIAVDTPKGLVVPVIRDADQKGFVELAQELMDISDKARNNKLTPKDMSGGCMSISSLGGIGGKYFTPLINAPEVAILGVSRHKMSPVWNGTEFAPRLMLPLSLSYDHRVIDGADGARFIMHLSKVLDDMRRLML